jgi:2-haloacid dehalogenase
VTAPARTAPIVVFDVGNVLLRWDVRFLYRKLFSDAGQMDAFLANICTPAWNLEQDRGRTWAEAVKKLVAEHPQWEREIRAHDERWQETISEAISGSVAVLERLKALGQPVYAITNFSAEKWDDATARFPFLTLFDGVVVSAHERLLKPDPAIYRVLFARYGLVPGDCIFIDDSAANIAAAQALGMKTVHFVEPIDLATELTRLGVNL